jgi:hypothetical protein
MLLIHVTFSSSLFGYDAGVMTDVIGSNNFLKYFNATNIQLQSVLLIQPSMAGQCLAP